MDFPVRLLVAGKILYRFCIIQNKLENTMPGALQLLLLIFEIVLSIVFLRGKVYVIMGIAKKG